MLNTPSANFFALFYMILFRKWKPDIVVSSLWYSHLIGALLSFLGVKWIAFFHNSGFSHIIDKKIHAWAWRSAHCHFVDSIATKEAMIRLTTITPEKLIVIPYNFPLNKNIRKDQKSNGLIWIGRNVQAKRIDLFFKLVSVVRVWSNMKCVAVIAGKLPLEDKFKTLADKLNVELVVNISNNEVIDLLSSSDYYVLTSDYEGMSMTTIEAVQSGCIPVVRPVGEIPSYLNNQAAIFINEIDDSGMHAVSTKIKTLENSSNLKHSMLKECESCLMNLSYYKDSFKKGIEFFV